MVSNLLENQDQWDIRQMGRQLYIVGIAPQ